MAEEQAHQVDVETAAQEHLESHVNPWEIPAYGQEMLLLLALNPKNSCKVSNGLRLHQIYMRAKMNPSPIQQIGKMEAKTSKPVYKYMQSHKKSAQVQRVNISVQTRESPKQQKYIAKIKGKENFPWKSRAVSGRHRFSSNTVALKVQNRLYALMKPRLRQQAMMKAPAIYVRVTTGCDRNHCLNYCIGSYIFNYFYTCKAFLQLIFRMAGLLSLFSDRLYQLFMGFQSMNCVTYYFQYQDPGMSFFGVELNSQINRLILEIRLKLCQNKYSPNFRTIYRSLASHDPKVSGLISPLLFQKALNENGLFFKKFEIQAFEKAFLNQVGMVNWFAFLHHLREPMGPYRREVIQGIFDQLTGGKGDVVTVNQLKQRFNGEGCDQFQKVTKNEKTVFQNFISLFPIKDGQLSREEFILFYDDLSINFPNDEAFARYACNQWNSKPKKQQTVNDEQIKSAIKALRFKLIQKTDGTKDQFLMRKLFNEFDRNKNQSIGAYEFDLMLKKLELPTQARLITPLLNQLDKNKSGYIEYDEFKKFVFFDPFPK